MYGAIIGGTAEHLSNYAGELGPAAKAQRQQAKKSATKLRSGDFGSTEAQKNTAYAQAAMNLQGVARQQNADLSRNMAAGNLTGGAAADATRAAVAAQQNAAAQAAGHVQASSDAQARNDYQQALATVDAAAARHRSHAQRQGAISWKAANGAAPSVSSMGGGGGTPGVDQQALLGNRNAGQGGTF